MATGDPSSVSTDNAPFLSISPNTVCTTLAMVNWPLAVIEIGSLIMGSKTAPPSLISGSRYITIEISRSLMLSTLTSERQNAPPTPGRLATTGIVPPGATNWAAAGDAHTIRLNTRIASRFIASLRQ